MKIAAKAIESYLAQPDKQSRAVLFYGPDAGLVRERAGKAAAAALPGKPDPMALLELTEARLLADPALLADELSSISLMAPKRVITIRDGGDKLTRIIEEAAPCFHAGVFLIVCGGELPSRSSLRGWFEQEANCAAVACYHDEARDVQALVRKAFEGAGIAVERDMVEYLSAQLGNDRYVTHQELEKLITYAGEAKQLRLEEAQALVDYNRETSFDDAVNAVADRNIQALERMLTLLLREGVQPVAYLRAMQRYFNRLYLIRARMSEGQSAEQVVQSLRPPVFFRQAPILTRHAQGWSGEQTVKALKLLTEAELACKTSDLPPIAASSRRVFQVTQIR